MAFRMKKKPVEPVRQTSQYSMTVYDTDASLEKIFEEFKEHLKCNGDHYKVPDEIKLSDVYLYLDNDYYYDSYSSSLCLAMQVEESDKSYQRRLDDYEKSMVVYDEWYEKNADKIQEHLARKEAKEQEADLKRKEREIKEREQRIKKLEKELKKLKAK